MESKKQLKAQLTNEIAKRFSERIRRLEERNKVLARQLSFAQKTNIELSDKVSQLECKLREYEEWNERLHDFVNMTEEDRIHRFMEDSINLKYGGVKTKNGKAFGVVNGGAIFGDVKDFTIIFKTFVDDSLLRKEQVEYGEEVIDSFKERMNLFREVFG